MSYRRTKLRDFLFAPERLIFPVNRLYSVFELSFAVKRILQLLCTSANQESDSDAVINIEKYRQQTNEEIVFVFLKKFVNRLRIQMRKRTNLQVSV